VFAIRDESRQHRCRAEAPVRGKNGSNARRRWRIVEENIAPAIDLQIDESWGEPGAFRQIFERDFAGNIGAPDNRGNLAVFDQDRTVLAHGGSVEHGVSGNGKRLARHRVRVTFCRWRGLSASTPRSFANSTAAA